MPRRPRYPRSSSTPHRSGAILLVVLVLLALFAVVGLMFVCLSGEAANSARIYREGQSDPGRRHPDSTSAAAAFLGQLVYPVGDTGPDTTTALRGHDLARLIYGANPAGNNTTPYNGVGLFHEPIHLPGVGTLDRAEVINFTYRHDPLVPANASIVDPERWTGGSRLRTGPTAPFVPVPGMYVGKNASYTYPDRNNLAVGVADPSTGQVVVPSFHRPTLFGRLDPPIPGVHRPNPNWTNSAGRFKILRPRPADHVLFPADVSQFPYPPPNADGSFTGDVQNLWGGVGAQRNDSVWLYANLGVVEWRGRQITPLVAPLVVPLDGRVNLNVAGNIRNSGSHASNMGFGPYEVSLLPIFPTGLAGAPNPAAAALVQTRYHGSTTPSPRGATTIARVFHPDPAAPQSPSQQTLPSESARVDWDGAGPGLPLRLPGVGRGGGPFASVPMWPAEQFDNSDFLPAGRARPSATGEAAYHPGFFVPYQWDRLQVGSQSPTARLFPVSDIGWFGPKYSAAASEYTGQTYLGQPGTVFASMFNGSGPGNPANAVRMLVTPVSNSLRRPGLAPNFFGGGDAYTLTGTETVPALSPSPPILDLAAVASGAAAGSDVGTSPADVRNRFAGAAAVDLNRPLTDYRADRLSPLGPKNIQNFHAAWRDRQALATDILSALVIATGASADIETRRWLAQVAVNMVDAIDNDDISTPFVWNPIHATDPLSPANFAPAELPNRVVFGVEKPRLVINETYAEIANDPADRSASQATQDFQVRFFVELLNPGSAETDSTNPQYYDGAAPGAVPLRYRAQGLSAYRVGVYTNGNQVRRDLGGDRTGNVTGLINSASPKLLCDFLGVRVADPLQGPLADRVEPNSGRYAARFPNRHGFAVICPTLNPATADSVAFVPDPKTDPLFRLLLQKPADVTAGTNQLYYTWPSAGTQQANIVPEVLKPLNTTDHAIVLQRLACPYAPPGPTNPYLTVDYMTGVQIQDAIRVAADGPRNPSPSATSRNSIGRIQPLAAAGDPTLAYPKTLVLKQQNLDSKGQPTGIQASFFRHNGTTASPPVLPVTPGANTLLAPFEWLVHLDRRIVNACELFHVATVKPHELTHQFAVPQSDGPPLFHCHDLQHPATGTVPAGALFATDSTFHRALELLAVKPWLHGVPEGGRVPGKVNLNMVWDRRVFDAVLDPQPANTFTSADVDVIWQGLTATRTPGFPGKVGATYDEIGPGGDRPLKGLGSPVFQPGGGNLQSTGLDDTLLRPRPADGLSLFQRPEQSSSTPLHPYLEWEPLRKASNNVTTVTDTYLVVMTVGYFEVRGGSSSDPNNPVILGAEVWDTIPGDMRTQFVAVVDRTALVAQFASAADETPWMGELQQSLPAAAAGAVVRAQVVVAADTPPVSTGAALGGPQRVKLTGFYNGFPWVLEATYDPDTEDSKGTPFFLGVGGKQDLVEAYLGPTDPAMSWKFDPVSGVVTLPVRVGPKGLRAHHGGEAVSNAVFGNPGPQPGFDPLARRFQPVVPFFRRVPR